ncbi:hypothetical protein [Dyella sp. C11]|uniref:hypothetical protein n=1 Tax=Dyella sp. C11 TaxID=2126991 RepID=UPI000D655977|nr:hypothetical protein [Dyella sp. C11]
MSPEKGIKGGCSRERVYLLTAALATTSLFLTAILATTSLFLTVILAMTSLSLTVIPAKAGIQ